MQNRFRFTSIYIGLCLASLAALALAAEPPAKLPSSEPADRWSAQQAWHWLDGRKVYGFNYNVRTAVNDIEQWQPATFDLKTIDQEFGWA
jgi:hypothetical protein